MDISSAVNALRALLLEEKFLYLGNPADEKTLSVFLHSTDFNVEKAFEKIKCYYQAKDKYSEFYAFKRDPKLHDVILRKGINTMLENRDQLGRRLLVYKTGNLEYGAHEVPDMFQVDDLWLTVAQDEEETCRNGLVLVFDLKGFPWKFFRAFTPYNIRAATTKAENMPVKNTQFHVINYGRLFGILTSLVFPFLKEETKKRVYFHSTLESFHTHVSPKSLPDEYGGETPFPDQDKRVRNYLDPQDNRLSELLSFGYMKKPLY